MVIVNFWSAECPHSERTDGLILKWMMEWASDVVLLPIAMNRNESAEMMKEAAKARGISIVLNDAEQVVTDAYGAEVTPHVFVVDREGILRYRGAVDDVTFRKRKPRRSFLAEVVTALLEGKQPEIQETRAYGCAIVREI